jgi:hypothetical protein
MTMLSNPSPASPLPSYPRSSLREIEDSIWVEGLLAWKADQNSSTVEIDVILRLLFGFIGVAVLVR